MAGLAALHGVFTTRPAGDVDTSGLLWQQCDPCLRASVCRRPNANESVWADALECRGWIALWARQLRGLDGPMFGV